MEGEDISYIQSISDFEDGLPFETHGFAHTEAAGPFVKQEFYSLPGGADEASWSDDAVSPREVGSILPWEGIMWPSLPELANMNQAGASCGQLACTPGQNAISMASPDMAIGHGIPSLSWDPIISPPSEIHNTAGSTSMPLGSSFYLPDASMEARDCQCVLCNEGFEDGRPVGATVESYILPDAITHTPCRTASSEPPASVGSVGVRASHADKSMEAQYSSASPAYVPTGVQSCDASPADGSSRVQSAVVTPINLPTGVSSSRVSPVDVSDDSVLIRGSPAAPSASPSSSRPGTADSASHSLSTEAAADGEERTQASRRRTRSNLPGVPAATTTSSRRMYGHRDRLHLMRNLHERSPSPDLPWAQKPAGAPYKYVYEMDPESLEFFDRTLLENRDERLPVKLPFKMIAHKLRHVFCGAPETLRGHHRRLIKTPEERVRRPVWHPVDIDLLRQAVQSAECRTFNQSNIKWRAVSDFIVNNGGTYRFGNATCSRKWSELCGEE
ncbi:hypothetical protein DCS_03465 [Drechmeria coniospora]|uniref:Myb-like domain-containing protein n=1 Tax=Drechmeria coniospora TaxID=98403 RepID=A0A151GH78_DRECN|nr:hypothetical protein DCS_03465 [Drechmeria coniospora]KYK56465.1 hypothetical protein DCS_03465 [Drechmeria coniospora]